MKSSLREPRYGVCEERMRRQFDETLRVATMSMDLSISCSGEDDRPLGEVNRARNEEFDSCDDSGACAERDFDTDERSEIGHDAESGFGFSWGYFDADGAHVIDRSDTAIGHEQDGDSFVEAQDPEHRRDKPEGGDWIATEPDWNAESALVYGDKASLAEAPRSEERGPAEDRNHRSGRRHRSKSKRRSKSRDRGSGRDSGRQRSKERRRSRRATTPQDLDDFPVPFVGSHDEEICAPSFMGKQVSSSNCSTGSQDQNSSQSSRGENQSPITDRGLKINPNEYDAKGRCVRHPQVRICKKTLLGGWKTLISACPNCCLEELLRIQLQLAEEHQESSVGRQERSQDCTIMVNLDITRRSTSQNGFRDTATANDKTSSLTTSSWGSQHQDSTEKERVAARSDTKKEKKKNKKNKEKKKRKSSRPPQLPLAQDRHPGTCVSKMRHTDKDDRPGIYGGRGHINANVSPRGQDITVYSDDGSIKEGEWENGRRQPQGASDGGGFCSHLKLRSKPREDKPSTRTSRRRRPTRLDEIVH